MIAPLWAGPHQSRLGVASAPPGGAGLELVDPGAGAGWGRLRFIGLGAVSSALGPGDRRRVQRLTIPQRIPLSTACSRLLTSRVRSRRLV